MVCDTTDRYRDINQNAIKLLADGERTVTELYSELDCSQSVMSSQLSILRTQGLVNMRREGNVKYCSLRTRAFLQLFKCLESHIHDVLKID